MSLRLVSLTVVATRPWFSFRRGSEAVYFLLYVDDIILTASSTELLQCTISLLAVEFAMKDLGDLSYFLGITATRDEKGIFFIPAQICIGTP